MYSIFGFKYKKDGKRVVREVYIEVARKCGKSTLAAGIMLYCLTADGENEAQIIFAANSYSQAQLAFTMSKNFISHLDKKGKLFKTFRDQIKFPATMSIMKVVSADADKLDGLNCSAFVLDEYHAAKSNNVANVLTSSVGMREQPLMLYITTAGFDMTNPCYQLRSTYIDILDGKLQDDSIFSAIYTLDDGDDIEDEEVWIKCQPNLDLTVTKEYIHSQLNKAKNSPLLLTNFKTKLMNIWCSNANGEWIGSNYINECTAKFDLSDSMFSGCSGYLGIDLSSTSDLTAISLMIPLSDRYYFKNWYYLPEVTLKEGANREKYAQWKRQRHLNITSGNVVDYNRVIADIEEINKIIPIEAISYDQWQSTMATIQLTDKGFNCQSYSQTTGALNKPTRYMEIIARSGRAVFDDNPILRWNFANCEIFEDSNGNIKPTKINKDSQKKIDGVHAMLNALGNYLQQPQYDNTITGFTY
ncbi:phage terminase [Prevotella intermedia ZT]|uniref:Phage terminase n=1 Tax=Prevotella intermedia ZT TaxID=1347790 RepID=A0AAP0VEW5_PREIN|nr:phage terminase [Prevotella intermedia ZT]